MTSAVPAAFHLIRLDLAREPGHPAGSPEDRYTLVLPLDAEGRILEDEFRRHPGVSRATHVAGEAPARRAVIRRQGGGRWVFDYGQGQAEAAFRLSDERFQPGEYVTIVREDEEHTYRVVSVQRAPAGAHLADAPQA